MKGSHLLAFLGGAIVGAGVALLLAPQSGAKTRRQISDFVEDTVDDVKDFTHRAGEEIKHAVHHGTVKVRHKTDELADAACKSGKKIARMADEKLAEVEKATR